MIVSTYHIGLPRKNEDGEFEWPGYVNDTLVGFYPNLFFADLALRNIAYAQDHGILPVWPAAEMARLFSRDRARLVERISSMSDPQRACQARAHIAYMRGISSLTEEGVLAMWKRIIGNLEPTPIPIALGVAATI